MSNITINELKMYSPNQVLLGTLFFGPLTMLFFLWSNFKTLGKAEEARQTLIYGGVFALALVVLAQFMTLQVGIVMQVIYSLCALQVVNTLQMTKEEIETAGNYSFQSNWRVVTYGICLYLMWFALIYPVTKLFAALGIIN